MVADSPIAMRNMIPLKHLADYHNQALTTLRYRLKNLDKLNEGLLVRFSEKSNARLYVSLPRLKEVMPELLPGNRIVEDADSKALAKVKRLEKKIELLESKLDLIITTLQNITSSC